MNDLGINLNYSDNAIVIKNKDIYDSISMKTLGATQNIQTCNLIYDLHVDSPILQTEEKRQGKLLDANYTKVDIDDMVKDLDVPRETKRKLTAKLKKFKTLFGGGLGKLDIEPIDIELKPGTKPYAGSTITSPKHMKNPSKEKWNGWSETTS